MCYLLWMIDSISTFHTSVPKVPSTISSWIFNFLQPHFVACSEFSTAKLSVKFAWGAQKDFLSLHRLFATIFYQEVKSVSFRIHYLHYCFYSLCLSCFWLWMTLFVYSWRQEILLSKIFDKVHIQGGILYHKNCLSKTTIGVTIGSWISFCSIFQFEICLFIYLCQSIALVFNYGIIISEKLQNQFLQNYRTIRF